MRWLVADIRANWLGYLLTSAMVVLIGCFAIHDLTRMGDKLARRLPDHSPVVVMVVRR
jgi:hypothetical protein